MADKSPYTGKVSFSAIILAEGQIMRIPAVSYEKNNPPVRIYLNFCDSLNLREFTINEIEARKNELRPTRDAIEEAGLRRWTDRRGEKPTRRSSSAAPTKNITVAKSHTTPSRVLRSRHTLERMEAATAMPRAPHRGFSTTIDRSTRSPDVSKKPKATKAGLDAAMHVLRNGKITGLHTTVSKRQCLRTRHGPSEPESVINETTKIRTGGKGEGGTPNIHSKPSSLASHRPKRIDERGWTSIGELLSGDEGFERTWSKVRLKYQRFASWYAKISTCWPMTGNPS